MSRIVAPFALSHKLIPRRTKASYTTMGYTSKRAKDQNAYYPCLWEGKTRRNFGYVGKYIDYPAIFSSDA